LIVCSLIDKTGRLGIAVPLLAKPKVWIGLRLVGIANMPLLKIAQKRNFVLHFVASPIGMLSQWLLSHSQNPKTSEADCL
jgi:hypothetical protein